MKLRDTLNTFENYKEIIDFNLECISDWRNDIYSLLDDEKKGIQRNPRKNLEVIQYITKDITSYQEDLSIAMYSAGYPTEQFKKEFFKEIDSFLLSWKSSYGYVQMIRFLSIGIMLNIDKGIADKIIQMIRKDNPADFLIDTLISFYDKNWKIHHNFTFPKPYIFTKEVVELAKQDKLKALFKLKYYLDNLWYKGHKDCGWYNMHKINKANHIGYWSFESGALVKILGLDDSILKDQQYYPYDLVHYQES